VKTLAWGATAIVANAALFFLVAHAQPSAKARPSRDSWVVREVFQAAPPPRPPAPLEDAARSVPDQPSAPQELSPSTTFEAPATESFVPRTAPPSFDIGPTGIASGPPVPLPFGPPGGPLRQPSQTSAPQTALSLDQVDRAPQPAVTPLPPYPQWARARKLVGVVTLNFTVDAEGSVRDVSVETVEGDERFGQVAVEAVLGWKFQPGLFEGRKVAVRVSQRVRFRLVD
jgi:protein TonB